MFDLAYCLSNLDDGKDLRRLLLNHSGHISYLLSIGRGKLINPYLKGIIVDFLRKELRPKELRLVPEEFVFDGEREISERTVTLNWMKQWLKWLTWYYTVTMDPFVSFIRCSDLCDNLASKRPQSVPIWADMEVL